MIEIFHLIKIDFKIPLINNELKFIPAVMGTASSEKSIPASGFGFRDWDLPEIIPFLAPGSVVLGTLWFTL